jgi:hypothetical protein
MTEARPITSILTGRASFLLSLLLIIVVQQAI